MSQTDTLLEVVTAPRMSRPRASSRGVLTSLGRGALGWLFPLALFALWQIASAHEWIAPQILPAPSTVGRTLLEQYEAGDLLGNFAISLQRIAFGFSIGTCLGLALGVWMGLSQTAEQTLSPIFKALSQVPVLGWIPLAMMLFGIGESLKVVIIAQASLVPVALSTLKGIRGVPRQYVEVARALRFSHAQLLHKVILPGAVPAIFVGIRNGLTQAWLSLVTVELLASSEGLGFMIVWGRQLFQLDLVVSAILVVGVVGLLLDKSLALVEARLQRWRPESDPLVQGESR
ncbi:MAG: sulfonate transporter [Myxococcaceae bacterium]|nr:sulfonate transporter [Myxococcaceae bacterium]